MEILASGNKNGSSHGKKKGGRLPILMVGITRRLNEQGRGYRVKKIMAVIGIEVHERESESVTSHSVQGSVR